MSHQLPQESQAPAEEPPPYSEIAEGGNVSVDEGTRVNEIRRWDVQTNRPQDTGASAGSSTGSVSAASRPPAPLPQDSHQPPPGPPPRPRPSASLSRPTPDEKARPPPGPPPGPPPNRYNHSSSSSRPSQSHLRPPPGRPESVSSSHSGYSNHSGYSSHSNHSSHGGGYNNHGGGGGWQPPYSQNLPPQWPPNQPNPHLRYPPGYFCKKCHNTGIKVKKGTTCKDCYRAFGVSTQAQYLPPGVMPMFPVAPRVVMPGDPSIGGALCGRCRGSGVVHDLFIFEDQCPVCHGVGRVF